MSGLSAKECVPCRGGVPPLEAEEIARLIYGLADPVRAQRYPLTGTLLDRVRRVVTPLDSV